MQIKWQWRHKMSKITKNGVSLKTLYVSNWNVVHLLYSSQSSTKPKKSVKQQTRHFSFWKGQVSFCVMVTGMLLWWQFFQYINPAKFQPCGLCTGMPYFVILHRFRVNLVTSQVLWFAWNKILNNLATKNAVTIKQTPFFIILKALLIAYQYYVNCGQTNEMKMWSSQLWLRWSHLHFISSHYVNKTFCVIYTLRSSIF